MADWNRDWERGGYPPPAFERDGSRWDRERPPEGEALWGHWEGDRWQWEPWHREQARREGHGLWNRVKRGLHVGKGPKGYTRSDDRIREDVCEMLERDPDVDASEIVVSVVDREVTLSGSVENRYMKRRSEKLAEISPGVRDVHNRLRLPGGEEGAAREEVEPAAKRPHGGRKGTAGGTLGPGGLAATTPGGSLGAAPRSPTRSRAGARRTRAR